MAEKKEKQKIPRQKMPEQEPRVRARNFNEVPFGYNPEQARLESSRCLQCKKPKCIEGCPVEIDIPAFVKLISEGDYSGAARKLKERNSLPAVCGRVCPQEDQCEKLCIVGKKDEPVAVGRLERFAADWERGKGGVSIPEKAPPTGKKVAVVGSGPAGLTLAGDLILKGHEVTIFEALHKTGGVLIYGIPEFRLPKDIVQAEVNYVESLGVKMEVNCVVGRIETVDELLQEYDAVFLGLGAGLPQFLGVPGRKSLRHLLCQRISDPVQSHEGLSLPSIRYPDCPGKNVAVFGAGNVAMDQARTALRLGAETVRIIYRRSRDEMPARIEEIHHAEEEGVQFHLLTAPVRFLGNDQGWVTGVECLRMELGEPDESGRRRPIPIKGSEFQLECDLAVVAIGAGPNPLLPTTTPGLELNKRGYIVADLETGKTRKPGRLGRGRHCHRIRHGHPRHGRRSKGRQFDS